MTLDELCHINTAYISIMLTFYIFSKRQFQILAIQQIVGPLRKL